MLEEKIPSDKYLQSSLTFKEKTDVILWSIESVISNPLKSSIFIIFSEVKSIN